VSWCVRIPGHVDQPPQAASPASGCEGPGGAAGASGTCRRAVRPGRLPGRCRPPAGCLPPERQPLAYPLASRRGNGVADPWADRPPPQGRRRPAGGDRTGAAQGRAGPRLRHRCVDAGPHRGGHPGTDRGGAVESDGVAAAATSAGLERATPQRQAKERDEEAIQHWVAHEWPRIKKGPAQNRPGSSSSTNQASR
jgi:hypothetical protein